MCPSSFRPAPNSTSGAKETMDFLRFFLAGLPPKEELRDQPALQSNDFGSLQHRFIALGQSLVMLGVK